MRNRLAPILWTGLMSESLREIQRTLVVQSDDLKYKVVRNNLVLFLLHSCARKMVLFFTIK
jgi:hypothetical protein